ncbi:aldo/keto reductase [Geomicrobium sp. JCM 19055]|uniref:aldo/keto reductase n=1 Tax=Geomicrobium sp. JCM 19055 TaxID=1460649 RepID=UPI00045EDBAA|nr:aldo/keto reductase [Geomicrobium sp. JCM 19055]GAK00855.1 oxidoreductase [Geomicrobium sp. JCM 19055]
MTSNSIKDVVRFHNGLMMPQHGFGVYLINEPSEAETAIHKALDVGYRSFDTAKLYENEGLMAEQLRNSSVNREDLFITTKTHNDDQGYDQALRAFHDSLEEMKLDYVDLLLVHWPSKRHFHDTWRAFERLEGEGLVRAIGVCNYQIDHLKRLETKANVKPVINQVECHPYLTQYALKDYMEEEDIVFEAWSPLGRGNVLSDPVIEKIANRYHKTPAQVVLRWHLQQDSVIIPKSKTPERIEENADIYNFVLTEEDMMLIDQLNRDERRGPDPDVVYEQI